MIVTQKPDLKTTRLRIRNVAMVLLGAALLLMKSWFRDSIGSLAFSYLGNISASFAVFFMVAIALAPRLHRLWIAALALVIVEAFELTDGFGVMTNVYDSFDYLANALGVALAYSVDLIFSHFAQFASNNSGKSGV